MNIEYGHDFLEQQLPRDRQILAVVTEPLFDRTSSNFQNHDIHPVLPPEMEEKELERWVSELPKRELVVGIGGGVCMDAAKFVAWKNDVYLWQAPSIVSVDAAVTETIGIRRDGIVKYIGTIWPEKVLVDIDLIQSAPKHINRAGSGDILSIHTALYDWKLAAEITGEPYHPDIADQSNQLLDRLGKASSDIYNVTSEGIKELMNLYVAEVDLCQQMGNSRPEEGSEHFWAYHVEYLTGQSYIHGELVALGILLMSALQENELPRIKALIDSLGIRYRPEALHLDHETLITSLVKAKIFVQNVDLPYSILHHRSIDIPLAEKLIEQI